MGDYAVIVIRVAGGSGKGFWVDLSQAVVPADPADLHPDSKAAERLSKALSHPSIRLPGSVEDGMHDFTHSLARLVETDWVDLKTAERYAPNADALRARVRGIQVKADVLVSKSRG